MPLPEQRFADALAGRYEIEAEVGAGGQAVVYRARDVRHERFVALKILRPELSFSLGGERFLREIRLAASLQHPHILPVYDSGDVDGLLFFVMPFIDGESLRARIARDGPLPIEDALRWAREIADALQYAHEHDVVHRDIKPENILLSGGHALVADFGIARAISNARGMKLTETGLFVGTAAYMSPEQASGETPVDARADVYSLGCVAYEMLTGTPPFDGPTRLAVIAKHSAEAAAPVRTRRATVEQAIDDAVLKALAKAPADRFWTARQFAEALAIAAAVEYRSPIIGVRQWRKIAMGAGVLAAVGLAAALWSKVREAPQDTTIAVAPVRSLSADSADRFLADGLAIGITNGLARVKGLSPRPYATVAAAATRASDATSLGRVLGVSYILSITLRRRGDELRLNSELIRVQDGSVVWSPQPFVGSGADVFRWKTASAPIWFESCLAN
jgi:serine/threonine-protein kinase